MFLLI